MREFYERSAYPKPLDFEVMRPEYEEHDDGTVTATITVTPFEVQGSSVTEPGARRRPSMKRTKPTRPTTPVTKFRAPFLMSLKITKRFSGSA